MKSGRELVLVLGIDGSGKSTMLNGLHDELGYHVVEPTDAEEANRFKRDHSSRSIDLDFVTQRRDIFRQINSSLTPKIHAKLSEGNVATSGLRIVTDISHNVMTGVVTNRKKPVGQVIDEWTNSDEIKPEKIVFLHAPIDIIKLRIQKRQQRGVLDEEMTGFNSPFFLGHYQDALHETAETLSRFINVLTIDTSLHSTSSLIELYKAS